jgi:hypothetical protein
LATTAAEDAVRFAKRSAWRWRSLGRLVVLASLAFLAMRAWRGVRPVLLVLLLAACGPCLGAERWVLSKADCIPIMQAGVKAHNVVGKGAVLAAAGVLRGLALIRQTCL